MGSLKRRLLSALLCALLLPIQVTAYAAETGFSDVFPGSWYAEAVQFAVENGLMNGTGGGEFSPNTPTSLAMLVTILHRDAGSPEAETAPPEEAAGRWFAGAAAWAAESGLLRGLASSFAPDGFLTREDMVTVLWRYEGSPEPEDAGDYIDELDIAHYAARAVDWSREHGVAGGVADGRFDPKGTATRAQLAAILQRFLTMEREDPPMPDPQPDDQGRYILVACFSQTGTTWTAAERVQERTGGALFAIRTEEPYPDSYTQLVDAALDEKNGDVRPALARELENPEIYDVIFLGYPIWWMTAPMAVGSFLEACGLSGQAVAPFCTSAVDGVEGSMDFIRRCAGEDAVVLDGFTAGEDWAALDRWVDSVLEQVPCKTEQPAPANYSKLQNS